MWQVERPWVSVLREERLCLACRGDDVVKLLENLRSTKISRSILIFDGKDHV